MTLFTTIISDNFGGQFTKNYGTQQKKNTTAIYIICTLFIEVTFTNIMFKSSKQEDLNDPLLVRLSHTPKTDQIQAKFLKK